MYDAGMLKSVVWAITATALTGLLFLWACLAAYRGNSFPPQGDGVYVVLIVLWFQFLGWTNDTLAWLQHERRLRLLPFECHETTWGWGIDGSPIDYVPVRNKVFRAYPAQTIFLTVVLLVMLGRA